MDKGKPGDDDRGGRFPQGGRPLEPRAVPARVPSVASGTQLDNENGNLVYSVEVKDVKVDSGTRPSSTSAG